MVMTRAQTPRTMSYDRDEIEQIAHILGRLEKLLTDGHDNGLATHVTEYLVGETDIEWLARWIIELRNNLYRKLIVLARDRRQPPNNPLFGLDNHRSIVRDVLKLETKALLDGVITSEIRCFDLVLRIVELDNI